MAVRILTVPGLGGSGPSHWQTLWERRDPGSFARVEQRDWNAPDRGEWLEALDAAVARAGPDVVVAGHSLGALLVAVWGAERPRRIRGALLVAPPDADVPGTAREVAAWAPMPTARLPFRTILAASASDPFVTLARARVLAAAWGSELAELGDAGHVNSASELGPWPTGAALLARLRAADDPPR